MSSYFIANFTITDEEGYNKYVTKARETLIPYIEAGRLKMLVYAFGNSKGTKEGNPSDRIMILEFESSELANTWYHSKTYQKLIPLRQATTTDSWVTITDQYVPPNS